MAIESDTKSTIGDRSNMVSLLNALIHVCNLGYMGYMDAANGITSSAYKTMFAEYAHQRSRFAAQLANLVMKYGGDPDDDGHSMQMFQHGWQNIHQAIMGSDFGAVFAECEKSENLTQVAYTKVMELGLPEDVLTVVNQQFEQIVEARDRLHNLLEAYQQEHKN